VALTAALVSKVTGEGNTCLDLRAAAEKQLAVGENSEIIFSCPGLQEWCRVLAQNIAVGKPGDVTPLVLDDRDRLYLYRYWEYEQKIVAGFKNRAARGAAKVDVQRLREGLARLFSGSHAEGTDWQVVAAITAVLRSICVISGGPGTGKTTAIAKILMLIADQARERDLRIALAAPTGKAAARLLEAMLRTRQAVACPEPLKSAIPEETFTVHRLLGVMPISPYFRHNKKNLLPYDVVVVDEGSMVSLSLMAKLIEAMPESSRLVILGDKDQLGSVEAGAVLGSICDADHIGSFTLDHLRIVKEITGSAIDVPSATAGGTELQNCIVELRKNYRFGSASGIGRLSLAVRRGDGEGALSLFRERECKDIGWTPLPSPANLAQQLKDVVITGCQQYLQCGDPEEALHLFERFQILCAVREGPYGVGAVNALAERILRRAGLIQPEKTWYPGRPIMILRNDYQTRLFNGDVGLVLPDPVLEGDLSAFFPSIDGGVRTVSPARLPEHETVYAMTVHKSQGSEFHQVLLILPDRDLPLLTRELVYTAITRTKANIDIWGRENVFRKAISRSVMRTSGLRDVLWGV
jgi:exodeoxyribonuclease V alpha subunit